MTESLQVVEDGAETGPPTPQSRPSWLIGFLGFVVGLGLGVLVVQPDSAAQPVSAPAPSTTVPAESTTSTIGDDVEAQGVSTAVPGFPDALVAVARNSGSSLDHVLWPVSGDVIVRPMTGGQEVKLDVGSQFIAMAEEVPDADGVLLSLGRFNTMRPLRTGVSSYAWHDSEIGSLSYVANDGEGSVLYTVRADLDSTPVAWFEDPDVTLAGWGDWGWAVQETPEEIVLLNADGVQKDIEAGVALATHPSGWIFVIDGMGPKLVSAGGGVRRIDAELAVGTVRNARFSADASKVAVAGTFGIEVLDLETAELLTLAEFPAPSLAWSSDSRFVVAPTASGVVVFDLQDQVRGYIVLREHWFLTAGVVPPRSS